MGAERGSGKRAQTVAGIFSQGRGRGQDAARLKADLDSQRSRLCPDVSFDGRLLPSLFADSPIIPIR